NDPPAAAVDLDRSPSFVGKIEIDAVARPGDPDMDGPRRSLELRSRLEDVEAGADRSAAWRAPGHLEVSLAQPAAEAFAADGPGFPMPVDPDIGERRAVGGMEQLRLESDLDEDVTAQRALG